MPQSARGESTESSLSARIPGRSPGSSEALVPSISTGKAVGGRCGGQRRKQDALAVIAAFGGIGGYLRAFQNILLEDHEVGCKLGGKALGVAQLQRRAERRCADNRARTRHPQARAA